MDAVGEEEVKEATKTKVLGMSHGVKKASCDLGSEVAVE